MDFFARQDKARQASRWLVFWFALAVVLTVVAVYAVLALVFLRGEHPVGGGPWWWNPELALWTAVGTLAVIGGGTLFKMIELSRGGAVVAISLGGRPVSPQTTDPAERRLLNVVEEMAIASGVPVPDVYVLDAEEGINAFAAGLSPSDAVIGVTRGCLRALSRDELQGVIAHEFSHILNGDMRLNLRLIGWLNGLLCLAILGYYLLRAGAYSGGRSSSNRKGGGNPLPLIGLALLIIGWIGVFFGRLIKSAVSRQREYLADAAAVQFTRNPAGLVGALKKIGGWLAGSRILSPAAEQASHMFFGNGLKPSWVESLFSTHPPLVERIRVWEPDFDGNFPLVTPPEWEAKPKKPKKPGKRAARRPQPAGVMAGAVAAAALLAHAGTPKPAHLRRAAELLDELPDDLLSAARDPLGACALVYGVLLARESDELAEVQLLALPAAAEAEVRRLLPRLRSLPMSHRLPLIELCLPALRQMSPAQFDQFETTLRKLVEADAEIDLFEFALLKMVRRHLTPAFRPVKRPPVQFYSLTGLARECADLLAAMAWIGQTDPAAATQAYEAGWKTLGLAAPQPPLPESKAGLLSKVDAALDRLTEAAMPLRARVLEACLQTAARDGVLAEREAELLRAVADALECPLPVWPASPEDAEDSEDSDHAGEARDDR